MDEGAVVDGCKAGIRSLASGENQDVADHVVDAIDLFADAQTAIWRGFPG